MLVSTSMMVFNISLMRVALPTSLCWEPVSTAEPGPRRLGPGKGVRTWVADHGRGVFDYTHIARDYVNKNGFDRHWDDVAKVPYLYNEDTMDYISYDDQESIKMKVEYANEFNLGGVMFWEMSGDRDEELLDVIVDTLPGCTLPSRRLEDFIV